MKKRIACLLTLVMVLELTACKAPAPSTSESSISQPETGISQPETDGSEEETKAEEDGDVLPAVGEELSGFTLERVEPQAERG